MSNAKNFFYFFLFLYICPLLILLYLSTSFIDICKLNYSSSWRHMSMLLFSIILRSSSIRVLLFKRNTRKSPMSINALRSLIDFEFGSVVYNIVIFLSVRLIFSSHVLIFLIISRLIAYNEVILYVLDALFLMNEYASF